MGPGLIERTVGGARDPDRDRRVPSWSDHAITRRVLALLAIVCAAGGAFLLLGRSIESHVPLAIDTAVRDWVWGHRPGPLFRACRLTSSFGADRRMLAFGGLAALAFLALRRWRATLALVLATAATAMSYPGVKEYLRRPRPLGARWFNERTFSFPSGHATAATAILGTALYLLWREGRISGRLALLVGALPALAVGVSRVCLEVHWVSDVLGGWALGVTIAATSAAVYEAMARLGARGERGRATGTNGGRS
jgi:undecaprenyl-diphosphatase